MAQFFHSRWIDTIVFVRSMPAIKSARRQNMYTERKPKIVSEKVYRRRCFTHKKNKNLKSSVRLMIIITNGFPPLLHCLINACFHNDCYVLFRRYRLTEVNTACAHRVRCVWVTRTHTHRLINFLQVEWNTKKNSANVAEESEKKTFCVWIIKRWTKRKSLLCCCEVGKYRVINDH